MTQDRWRQSNPTCLQSTPVFGCSWGLKFLETWVSEDGTIWVFHSSAFGCSCTDQALPINTNSLKCGQHLPFLQKNFYLLKQGLPHTICSLALSLTGQQKHLLNFPNLSITAPSFPTPSKSSTAQIQASTHQLHTQSLAWWLCFGIHLQTMLLMAKRSQMENPHL